MNLIEELGLEKCKAIVDGAPEPAFAYDTVDEEYMFCGDIQDGYSIDDYEGCVTLHDLGAAIADHERTDYVSDIRNHLSPTTVVIER